MAVTKKKSKKQVAEEARVLETRREYLTEYLLRVDDDEALRLLGKYQHDIDYMREWAIPFKEMEVAIVKAHLEQRRVTS